jgi:hypothetical protein
MADEFLQSPRSQQNEGKVGDGQWGDRERIHVLVIGSRNGVLETIHNLHRRGFAEVNDWSTLLPAQTPGEVMSILIRDRVMERGDRM